jgi:2-keto-4-pentenoate hydratase/2-oxohepta-3-ene-1,7-dioic acid hydratase in catechol pathway
VSKPGKIVCIGRNYPAHVREMGNDLPKEPVVFFKPLSSMIGPGDAIVLPPESTLVEHEAEIAIVIGKRLRRATRDEAERGIRGFTCANDVTARDLQKKEAQWARAKGWDTFCPVLPGVVEGLDWRNLEVIGRVNGMERQRGKSSDMIFPIPDLLVYISAAITLDPGDLVLTGSPAGTGPLVAGDVVEVEIAGVGVLSNPVRAEAA